MCLSLHFVQKRLLIPATTSTFFQGKTWFSWESKDRLAIGEEPPELLRKDVWILYGGLQQKEPVHVTDASLRPEAREVEPVVWGWSWFSGVAESMAGSTGPDIPCQLQPSGRLCKTRETKVKGLQDWKSEQRSQLQIQEAGEQWGWGQHPASQPRASAANTGDCSRTASRVAGGVCVADGLSKINNPGRADSVPPSQPPPVSGSTAEAAPHRAAPTSLTETRSQTTVNCPLEGWVTLVPWSSSVTELNLGNLGNSVCLASHPVSSHTRGRARESMSGLSVRRTKQAIPEEDLACSRWFCESYVDSVTDCWVTSNTRLRSTVEHLNHMRAVIPPVQIVPSSSSSHLSPGKSGRRLCWPGNSQRAPSRQR